MSNIVKVKICGITSLTDAQCAINAGAWALGFNFYEKSPRYIPPEKAKAIIDALPESVVNIGLFVNADADHITRIREMCKLDMVQFSGDEDVALRRTVGGRIIQAIRPASVGALPSDDALSSAEIILVDAPKDTRGLFGGSGNSACGECVTILQQRGYAVMLAGGVTPENAREKHERWCPFALDIASGVESSPGVKDAVKMGKLFENLNKEI